MQRKQQSLSKVLLPRTKRQQLQLLSQPQSKLELEDQDDEYTSDVDYYVGYRRPELVHEQSYNLDDDEELPDHILERLAQIRAMALEKYKEVHG